MSDSRTKNTIRNIKSGVFFKMVRILLIFINRTIILWYLGVEFTGLSSIFTSILQVLNLAELGFNTAVVYSLYKPFADNDKKKISEIVSLLRKIYYYVGTIILIGGLIIMPFIPYLINGSYPSNINLYLLYLLFLIDTVVSYYLFSYKECLLIADQRQDIANKIKTIIEIIKCVFQFLVIYFTKNYYVFLIVSIIATICINILIEYITRKKYPFYEKKKEKIKMPTEMKQQVIGLMINRICDTFRNSFDSIIISSLFGLTITAIYSNYYYVYSAIYGIVLIISNSLLASVGNSIIKKTELENYRDMQIFYWLYTWIICVSTTCLGCLFQPFMKLWAGDNLLLSNYNMILFCVYFYLINMNNIRNLYISGTGLWWKIKKSYLMEAIANLVLNILLGILFGITGVLLATIITIFLFNYLQRNNILFKYYFKNEKIIQFYSEQLYYIILTTIVFIISYHCCSLIDGNVLFILLIKGFVSVVISLILLFIGLRLSKRYEDAKQFIKKTINIKKEH